MTVRAFTGVPPSRSVFAAVREGSQSAPEIAAVLNALREVATGAVQPRVAAVGSSAA